MKNFLSILKKIFVVFLVVFVLALAGLVGLFVIELKTDPESLELEEIYVQTQSEEDLYKLCTALQESDYREKIVEYYPLLLNDTRLESFIENDPGWEDALNNMEPKEIKESYIIAFLDSVLEESGTMEYKKSFDRYIDQVNFIVHENGMPALSVLELYFYKESGMEISGIDKKKAEIHLDTLSEYINSADSDSQTKDYVNLFIYSWYSKIGNIEKMNNQRKQISKMITSTAFFKGEEELINGYILAFDVADKKVVLGKYSYADYFLIDVGFDVVQYACTDRYICVLQNLDGEENYFIIDTETGDVSALQNKLGFDEKCREININPEFKNSKDVFKDQLEDQSAHTP